MVRTTSSLASVMLALLLSGCGINFQSPNSATEADVLTSKPGIYGLAIGMQQYYATTAVSNIIFTPGTSTREVAINTTLANLVELELGGTSMLNNNSNVSGLWSSVYRVILMADQVLSGVQTIQLDPGTQSGLTALALWHKAAAIGFLAQAFEQLPIDVQADGNAVFKTRADALTEAIRLLDLAIQTVTTTPTSTDFKTSVLGSGFNLENTLQAYRARYSVLAGRYQEAITFANAVSPVVKSAFSYTTLSPNPVYQAVFVSKSWAPRDSLGLTTLETGDQRVAFYEIGPPTKSRPNNYPIDKLAGFWTSMTQSIPVYLPSEMNLIRAEADVQLGNLAGAVAEINAIRTKKPASDPFGVGASLAAYSGPQTAAALLTEIYHQRSTELYLSGMRLEDSRRLNRPGPPGSTNERNRTFYEYPQQERQDNPNVPIDPAD